MANENRQNDNEDAPAPTRLRVQRRTFESLNFPVDLWDLNIFQDARPQPDNPIALDEFRLHILIFEEGERGGAKVGVAGLDPLSRLEDFNVVNTDESLYLWWTAYCVIRDIAWLSETGAKTIMERLKVKEAQLERYIREGMVRIPIHGRLVVQPQFMNSKSYLHMSFTRL
jgi:hypothetical protein